MKRRFFLFTAPAIVAAPSLMRVSAAVLHVVGDAALYTSDFARIDLSFSEIVTETLRNHTGIADIVRGNNAVLATLRAKGYIELAPPGYEPDWPDDYNT